MKKIKSIVNNLFPADGLKFVKSNYRSIRGWYKSQQYNGNVVYCSCCDKSFSSFKDFNYSADLSNESRFVETYKNTDCPNCYSHPRHRIICTYLNENKVKLQQQNILMFGAEYSIEKWFRTNNIPYTTADLFDRTADIKADIQNTSFPDESWSLIICNHVLEHVPDYALALKELKRILKKDGVLEISVPTDRVLSKTIENTNILSVKERIATFGQIDHMRIFGTDIEKLLMAAGFFVEVIDGNTLPDNLVAKVGPANYDDNRIYLCKKW
ncbi:MAG TPA: class I SAM-dependent methyltransferase [Arachidicoccus sp.]